MSEILPVGGFEWIKEDDLSKFNESFIKNYDENCDKGCIREADFEYPKNLHNLHSDLPFLSERKRIERVKKLVCRVEDKENYVVDIRALKQALNRGLKLKRVHTVIQFNRKSMVKTLY